MMEKKIKLKYPLPAQAAFSHGVYQGSRNLTRTVSDSDGTVVLKHIVLIENRRHGWQGNKQDGRH